MRRNDFLDCPIATLGPKGTDSESAADRIKQILGNSGEIVLCDSFREAEEAAKQMRCLYLIPAAYTKKDADGKVLETWADVNFRLSIEGMLELHSCHVLPLKELSIARRQGCELAQSISLHPATEMFAQEYEPNLRRIYINSKPLAVEACSNGITDKCIGSSDVISAAGNLTIERSFSPSMVWAMYNPK